MPDRPHPASAGAPRNGIGAITRRLRLCAMVGDARGLLRLLLDISPSRAQVVAEGGGWSVFIPGLPVAADGATFVRGATVGGQWCTVMRHGQSRCGIVFTWRGRVHDRGRSLIPSASRPATSAMRAARRSGPRVVAAM